MYIVWKNYGTEGWKPSDEIETLEKAIEYSLKENYGNDVKITKVIEWEVIESE